MDGLAQSEYEYRRVSRLHSRWVNLTFRWVTQHIASCPQAGAMCRALLSCVQCVAKPSPLRWVNMGVNQWFCFWFLLLSVGVCFLLGHTLLDLREKRCCSGRRPSRLAVHPLSRGPARFFGSRRWRLSRLNRCPKRGFIVYSWFFFRGGNNPCPCFKIWVTWSIFCWIYE